MEIKILDIYTDFQYAELDEYDKDLIEPIARGNFILSRHKDDQDSYFLLSDIAMHIEKKRKDISYVFIVNKTEQLQVSEDDNIEYIYTIYFVNINMPFIENLNGKIEINSKFIHKDINKIKYILDTIKLFYSSSKDEKFLIISDMSRKELDKLYFTHYDIMQKSDQKKMVLQLPIVESNLKKIFFLGTLLVTLILATYGSNIFFNNYIEQINKTNLVSFRKLSIKKMMLTKKNKKLSKTIKEYSKYTVDNLYKVKL